MRTYLIVYQEYDWAGMWKAPNKEGKMWYKVLQQFTPFSYDEYNWDILKDYKRFLSVCIVVGMVSFYIVTDGIFLLCC